MKLPGDRNKLKAALRTAALDQATLQVLAQAKAILNSFECPLCGITHPFTVKRIARPGGKWSLDFDGEGCCDESLKLAFDHVEATLQGRHGTNPTDPDRPTN